MADTPKPGRGRPLPERFEVSEAHPTAHLTEEQKTWKVVKLRPGRERFEASISPALEFALLPISDPNQREEGSDGRINRVLLVLDNLEQLLGGRGLEVAGRQPSNGDNGEVIILHPRSQDGAAARLAKLADVVTVLGLGTARVA